MDHLSCSLSDRVGSAKMAMPNLQLICAVAVVAIATFINLPAPRFSKRLEEWRNMGQYFNFKGNAIFYQGEVQYFNTLQAAQFDRYWREYRDHFFVTDLLEFLTIK